MNTLNELRTPRLLLQRMRAEDFGDLKGMYTNPQVMATLGGIRSDDETRQYLDWMLAHWAEHGFGIWLLRDAQTGSFAGRGGLRHNVLEGRPETELVYGFMPEYWGRGLATELAHESLRVAFEQLQRPDVLCFTMPTNRASQRVMEKVGFQYERAGTYKDLPHLFYRLTAAAWQARKDGR